MADYDWGLDTAYPCVVKSCKNRLWYAGQRCPKHQQEFEDDQLRKQLARLFPDSDYQGVHREQTKMEMP